MRFTFAFVLVLISSISILMAEESTKSGEGGAVHIVYVDRPEGEDPEVFHIRTLASVVGGEDAAKESLIYHYKHAASGFSAKLTPQQRNQRFFRWCPAASCNSILVQAPQSIAQV